MRFSEPNPRPRRTKGRHETSWLLSRRFPMARKFRSLLAVTALALGASVFNSGGALCGLLDATRDGRVVMVPTDDPAMTAAFAKARGALDGFLAKLANPPPRTE